MPCSPSIVRHVPDAPRSSGRVRYRVLALAAAVAALLIVLNTQRLEWRGRLLLGPGPTESYVFANRSGQPYLARIAWSDSSSAPIFLPPRSTTDVELPVSASGRASTEVWRVDENGPGSIEHMLEWATVWNEALTVTLEPDGSETREVDWDDSRGSPCFALHSRLDRPVLAFFGDLQAAGGRHPRDDEGDLRTTWIAPAQLHSPDTIFYLDAGRAVRLRYRVAEIQLAASVKIDSREGTTHEIVIGSDGSAGGGSLSLLTRAGF